MPCSYVHLDLEERRRLFRLHEARTPVGEIAAALGRHRSTIYRELRRNRWRDADVPEAEGYWPVTAQDLAGRRRAVRSKLERLPELRRIVVERLRQGWSPEQIAGRLRIEPGAMHRLCHETIYRFVYNPAGRRDDLARHLPQHRRRRRPRRGRKPRSDVFPDHVAIKNRPEVVKDRTEFGHWEADLVMFRRDYSAANVATVVERTTRYTLLFRNGDRRSKPIMARLMKVLSPLPATARRSVTFDRGLEFVSWRALDGVRAWFCDPQAPWQKPTVENTNGRLRRHLPRDTDISALSERDVEAISDRLNTTPRKCLSFRTPAEAFHDQLVASTSSA